MVVVDADFLSAFFKIGKLDLVLRMLNADKLIITKTVFNELRETHFFEKFLEVTSKEKDKIEIKESGRISVSGNFGDGELTSIFLAEKTGDSLLMDDRAAGKLAEERDIAVMDIPAFLLRCKERGLSLEELKQIIKDLKEKDYYEFTKEVESKLLNKNAA